MFYPYSMGFAIVIYEFEPACHSRKQFYLFTEFPEIFPAEGYAGFSGFIGHEFHICQDIAGILSFGDFITHFPEFFRGFPYGLDESEFLHVPRRESPVEIINKSYYQLFSHFLDNQLLKVNMHQ